jgi:hypothetical protein
VLRHSSIVSTTMPVSMAPPTPAIHREGLTKEESLCSFQTPLNETESTKKDDQAEHDYYPVNEVRSLETRAAELSQPLPTLNLMPTGCGILQRLQLVGVFPTARWLDDVTMPPDVKEMFGGTPFHALGEYRVAHLDLVDSLQHSKQVTIIVNSGVEGMKTGYWGGTFDRKTHQCVAKFDFTGDLETTSTVKEQQTPDSLVFTKFENFEFLDCLGEITPPGICSTQLEKLVGITVEFLLRLDWKGLLHESLIEITDRSPRKERRQRAIQRMTPRRQKRSTVVLEEQWLAF